MSVRRKTQTGCLTLQHPRMTPDGLEVRGSSERGALKSTPLVLGSDKTKQKNVAQKKKCWQQANSLSSLPAGRSVELNLRLLWRPAQIYAPVRLLARQVSLHTCPRALFRELRHVFPGVDLEACLAVPTSQKADIDLVSFGDPVETEKDRLLNSVRDTL